MFKLLSSLVPFSFRFSARGSVAVLSFRLGFVVAGLSLVGTASADTTTNPVWTGNGGNTNWSNSGNWQSNLSPSAGGGDTVNFAGTANLSSNNDYNAYTQFYSILFNSGAGAFTLSGNAIKLYSSNPTSYPDRIENDSSSLQTVSLSTILFESNGQINPVSSNLIVNSSVYMDNGGGVLSVYGGNGYTLTLNGVVGQYNTTGSIILQQNSTVVFNAANTYTGTTSINAGTIDVAVAPTGTGTYYVGNGGNTTTAAALYLGSSSALAGGVAFGNPVSVNTGSSGNRTIGGLNTSGTNTFNGTLTLVDSNATLVAATGGAVAFNTITASSQQTVTVGAMGFTGTVQLGGTADNVNLGAVVTSGTLVLAKTGNSSAHAIGAGLTINSGATVQLSGTNGDQIYDSSSMTLNGGTFSANGKTETVGSLTLQTGQTGSALDFGLKSGVLTFASFTPNGTVLNITNYSGNGSYGGTDQLIFKQDQGPSGANTLNYFNFGFGPGVDIAEQPLGSGLYEIYSTVPVPEPATWLAGVLTLGLAGYGLRRRLDLAARPKSALAPCD